MASHTLLLGCGARCHSSSIGMSSSSCCADVCEGGLFSLELISRKVGLLTHSAATDEDSAALRAAGFAALLIAALLSAANSLLAFALGRSSKPEATGCATLLAAGFAALLEAALLMLSAAPAASSLLAFALGLSSTHSAGFLELLLPKIIYLSQKVFVAVRNKFGKCQKQVERKAKTTTTCKRDI